MLPFSNGKKRKAWDIDVEDEPGSDGFLRGRMPPSLRRTPSSLGSRGSFSSASEVPRLFRRDAQSRARKDAVKQDLNSCAFFAGLRATSSASTERALADTSWASPKDAVTDPEDSPLGAVSDGIDDPIWIECRAEIDAFEAILHGTFTTSKIALFDDGEDTRTSEQAFHDAKAAIRRASKRLSYHWNHEQHHDKLSRMLAEQILLGQRIRAAWAQAVARKERLLDEALDEMLDGQLELGSVEMGDYLDGLDPSWFEEEHKPNDHV